MRSPVTSRSRDEVGGEGLVRMHRKQATELRPGKKCARRFEDIIGSTQLLHFRFQALSRSRSLVLKSLRAPGNGFFALDPQQSLGHAANLEQSI
jgi:hypothetical protein